MKITNNISFGKKLVATCQLSSTDKDSPCCKIFELNNTEDKDYFEKLNDNPKWNKNRFVWVMQRLMQSKSIGKENDTFSLESQTGECLGYINVISHKTPHNKKFIQYLETAQEDKKTNFAKQTLVAFIVEQAKKENKDEVTTIIFEKDVRKFFKGVCGFKLGTESSYDFVLSKKHYGKFLEKYKKNTGSEITFIA
ncbi:MAG: hypothetical protein IJY61_02890 [Candidatus Gastranaerophilales bacterium]|nr:hypothetical protein [Candidatus Gastranaerophilales bacterium]